MTGPVCRCGHERAPHSHFRRGMDCALCECRKWKRPRRLPVSGGRKP